MPEALLANIPLLNKEIFDIAPIGMAISGFDGILVRVNQSFLNTVGYEKDEILGKSFAAFTHPDDLEINLKRNEQVAKGILDFHQMEKRFIHKDGRILNAILKVSTLKNERGNRILFLAQILDITDKVELITSIESSEKKFREIFEEAAISMAQATNEGEIFHVNKALCELLEYSESELIGMKLHEISHPKDLIINELKSKKLVEVGSGNYSMEKRYTTKSGKTIYTILKVSHIKGIPPESPHLLGQIVDISEQKRYEKLLKRNFNQLKKVNHELDNFIYRASHDLRGPLATLKGLINLAQLKGEENDLLDGMIFSVQKLENTIRELVEFSENAHKSITTERIDLNKIISECIEMLSYHPNYRLVELSKKIDPKLQTNSDLSRIKPIFNNLIANAITYIDSSKELNTVTVFCSTTKKHLIIKLIDNGIGMSEETASRASEMFYRGSELSTGSGLGLYLVKEIVSKLNGKFEIKSEEGIGTQIIIKLPNQLHEALNNKD